MRCPKNPEIWLADICEGDPRWTDHLAICPSCRAEADRVAALKSAMQSLSVQEAPASVATRLQALTGATAGQTFGCAETLDLLEPYREGLLTSEQIFLVEDHLLWCQSCAAELEAADGLVTALSGLQQLVPPDAIAERLAMARLPWWQRLWTAPAPSWGLGRLLQVGGAMAAAAVLFGIMFTKPHGKAPEYASVITDIEKFEQMPGSVVYPTKETPVPVPNNMVAVLGPRIVEDKPQPETPVVENRPVETAQVSVPIDYNSLFAGDDRMPGPSSKAGQVLAGAKRIAVAAKIAERQSADDRVMMADMPMMPTPPAPTRDLKVKFRPQDEKSNPDVTASAREALERARQEEELARSEEGQQLGDSDQLMATASGVTPGKASSAQPIVSFENLNDALRGQRISPTLKPSEVKHEPSHRQSDYAEFYNSSKN